jgi:glycerol-3-phosphate dehydrogenase
MLDRVRSTEQWDMVVIGGGATGLGIAVDAAARGYRTLLLEAVDYAKGTSRRSTKLVHGGVRYLAQGNIRLVREALHERGLLSRNAPHLVHALPFVIPLYHWWQVPWYGIGLKMYDLLAGRLNIGRSRIVGRDAALQRVPTLESDGLHGGVVYYDGQFDDSRLAITLLRTFTDLGGTALNYMPVTGFRKQGQKITGVTARDAETDDEFTIDAKVVINATGVYADDLRRKDDPDAEPMLSPSQGVHLVLDRSFLPGDSAIMIPRTDDGRVLFVIPWHDRVVVGTTDTGVNATPIEPRPQEQEIEFLMKHARRYLTKDPSERDVLSVFVGLRPLVKGSGDSTVTAAISRDHTISIAPSGLLTITGGKWTTYRYMAQDAVNKAMPIGGLPKRPCVTQGLRLHGWQREPAPEPFAVYGSDAAPLKRLLAEQPEWDQPLHPDLPYRTGEVVWAARYEQARTVEDVLSRRTRALLLDAQASCEAAPKVAELLAAELGFDERWQQAQVQKYQELASGYLLREQPAASKEQKVEA